MAWIAFSALAWILAGAGQAWPSGSAPPFAKLTGRGQALVEARGGAVAATLNSGEVLIAGGGHAEEGLASAELFSPATDTFAKLTGAGQSPAEPRLGAAATLRSGQVLIVGGYNDGIFLSSAELFNPTTDTFTKLNGAGQSLTEARENTIAATLPSGHVLIAGGWNSGECESHCVESSVATAELFNPRTETFSALASEPTERRWGAVAAALPDGEVLIAGGHHNGRKAGTAELFDPATDTFRKLTGASHSPTEGRGNAIAATLPSGEVLIAGGYGSGEDLRSAELFNPATEVFTRLAAGASLTEPRTAAVAATLPSGNVLIAGGEHTLGPGTLSSAELFVPAAQAKRHSRGKEHRRHRGHR